MKLCKLLKQGVKQGLDIFRVSPVSTILPVLHTGLYIDGSRIRRRSGRSLGTLKQDSALVGAGSYGLSYSSIEWVRCKPFCQELGTRSIRACTAETLDKQQAV